MPQWPICFLSWWAIWSWQCHWQCQPMRPPSDKPPCAASCPRHSACRPQCPVGLFEGRRSKCHHSEMQPPTLAKRLHASQNAAGFFDVSMCTVVPSVVRLASEGSSRLQAVLAHTAALLPRPPTQTAFSPVLASSSPHTLARTTRSMQGRVWEESLRGALPARFRGPARRNSWRTVSRQARPHSQTSMRLGGGGCRQQTGGAANMPSSCEARQTYIYALHVHAHNQAIPFQ